MGDFNEDCCVAWPCFLGPNMSLLALRYRFRDQQKIEVSRCQLAAIDRFAKKIARTSQGPLSSLMGWARPG